MLLKSLLFCFLGSLFWSFSEYALHNWYGHKAKGKNEFSREHLAHHINASYYPENWKKAFATLKVVPFIYIIISLTSGFLYGSIFTISFLFTYLTYEVIHRRIHTHEPKNFYARFIRKHHAYHHFSNPRFNHGVTSPIWDIIFKTYRSSEKIKVPENNAMKWLLDENNNIKKEYANDYELISNKSKLMISKT